MPPELPVCPEDETLLALVEGRLDEAALARVDTHLDECALCREVVATLDSGPRLKRTAIERADVVGRFVVLERIGEGAMGVVYAAYDPELDRKVALKLLHGGGDAKGRARLTREAQALARLTHPNVVVVYDVGVHRDEVYVAMELVEGRSLRAWLAVDRPTEDVLRVFLAAGEGLAAAHDADLVHRDFKPENVLVDERGAPKVVDFGLARGDGEPVGAVPEGALLSASLTRTGALLGTPAYMPPEQLAGEPADARADQFAFCVAMWEALEGARPFEGQSVAALREAIEAGPKASRMDRRVAAALRRGLSPKPADRFDDMAALLDELRPQPTRYAWILGAVALVVAGAATGLWGMSRTANDPCASSRAALRWTAGEDPNAAEAALGAWVARWTGARVDACEATHVRHEQSAERLDRRMSCLDRQRGAFEAVLEVVAEDDLRAIDAVESLPDPLACAAPASVDPPPAGDAEQVAALRVSIDRARVALATAQHEVALEQAARLVDEATALAYMPALAEAEQLEAAALRALARFDEADERAERAVLDASRAGDDRATAEAWLERVRVAGSRGRYDVAATWTRHAEAAIARAGDPQDLQRELLHVRGLVRTHLGELAAAERDLREAIESGEARYGERSPRLASLRSSLGDLLRIDSRLDEALAEHERALALDTDALGEDHPRVGRDLHNIAGVLRRLDRSAEARERYERALAIKRAAFGHEHPEVALTLNSLGLLAYADGDGAQARERWTEARTIFEAHAHGDGALSHFNLALLDLDESRWGEAETHARAAIALDVARIGPRSKRVGSANVLLARALVGQDRGEEAREAVAVAVGIADELGDPELAREARAARDAAPEVTPPPAPRAAVRPRPGPAAGFEPRVGQADEPTEPSGPDEPSEPPPPPTPDFRRPAGSGSYGASQAWE